MVRSLSQRQPRHASASIVHVTDDELRAVRTWRDRCGADALVLDLTHRDSGLSRSDARRAASADMVLVGSLTSLRETRRRYPALIAKTALLRIPLDLGAYAPSGFGIDGRDSDGASRRPTLLFAGPITPAGGIDLAIEALAALRDREGRPAFDLVALPAEVDARYLRWCKRRAASGGIVLSLRAPQGDAQAAWYQCADVACAPFRDPVAPDVARHAAAAGLPIIGTEIEPLLELVENGRTGYLVPVDDLPELTTRLARLALDPALRAALGRQARERAERELCPRRAAARLVSLWKSAVGREAV
jgi:glycosyltransferase involved in cell wall biosynthesis